MDIGAFESSGFTVTIAGGDNQSTGVNFDFANPLTVSVSSEFGEPVQGGVVAFAQSFPRRRLRKFEPRVRHD